MSIFDNNITSILAILATPFLLLLLYRIIRFACNILRYMYLNRKYKARYDKATKNAIKAYSGKPDEIIEKNREEEQKLRQETRKLNKSYGMMEVDTDSSTIVGIVKPKGIWTEYVTKQKLSWLRAMIGTKAESDSFWRNMIDAQGRAQGKQQSRQR